MCVCVHLLPGVLPHLCTINNCCQFWLKVFAKILSRDVCGASAPNQGASATFTVDVQWLWFCDPVDAIEAHSEAAFERQTGPNPVCSFEGSIYSPHQAETSRGGCASRLVKAAAAALVGQRLPAALQLVRTSNELLL